MGCCCCTGNVRLLLMLLPYRGEVVVAVVAPNGNGSYRWDEPNRVTLAVLVFAKVR
jgi:hypothetical protein